MKQTAIIIIILGIALTTYTSYTFFTREKVVDIGKIEITRDKPHNFSWTPLLGIAVIAVGGVVLWKSSAKQ